MGVLAPHEPQASVADAHLAALHERHAPHVLRFCRRHTASDAEADDAFQLTFVQVMRGLRGGVVPQYELAWLLAIARNVCREQWRTQQRRPRLVDDLDAVPDGRPPFESDRGIALDLDAALAQLPERHRTAILLREWRGLSYAEIANQMGLTEPAVETMLVRARRELATALEQGTQPKKRRASWRDLGWLADLVRRIATQGAGAKLATGAAVVAVTVSAGGASPASSENRGFAHASPRTAQAIGAKETHIGRRQGDATGARAGVSATHPGPAADAPPSVTVSPPAAPKPPGTTEPPQQAPAGPAATASPEASPPPVLVPVTDSLPDTQVRSVTVTAPSVGLPAPLPPTQAVTVSTPAVAVQAPTVTAAVPGP